MKFLMIAQTPSVNTKALQQAAFASLQHYADRTSTVTCKPPQSVVYEDLLDCDGLLLGTMENIGALAGLTKDVFDRCYHQWLGQTDALPVAIYIRAGLDGTATKRTLTSYAGALSWRLIQEPLVLQGPYDAHMCQQAAELAGSLSAGVEAKIF